MCGEKKIKGYIFIFWKKCRILIFSAKAVILSGFSGKVCSMFIIVYVSAEMVEKRYTLSHSSLDYKKKVYNVKGLKSEFCMIRLISY